MATPGSTTVTRLRQGEAGLAQNFYECMFIFDPNLYARDPRRIQRQSAEMVESCGGEMLASRLWNERELAYPIKGHRKGAYWLSYFKMESRGWWNSAGPAS